MMNIKNILLIAALALMGAMMTGCSSDDNFDNPQQPENKSNVVTLTTTVGFDASAGTRALTNAGVKTFAVGDQIAVIYKNTSNQTVTATSTALTTGDITNEGKNANFTVTLTNPKASETVRYIYPAAMLAATVATDAAVNADTNVKYEALATQDGTLTNLASKLDLAVFDGSLTSEAALPASASMTNQLAILACTLKSSGDINNTIKGMTISDGTYCYSVDRTPSEEPIYVAIRPTSGATISVSATNSDVTQTYIKNLTGKTYEKNNGYVLNWTMTASSYRMASAATSEDKGKQICAAGHIHSAGGDSECTETRRAKIVYVGNETGESPFGFIHGLALALSDANGGSICQWKTSLTDAGHAKQTSSTFTEESGLQYNDATHNSDTYPAFKAAITYSPAAPTGCSSWFLASGYQWKQMISAAGVSNLGLQEDIGYWSSTECGADCAWAFGSLNGNWDNRNGNKEYSCEVRACLAF